jgi:hypothetical protein
MKISKFLESMAAKAGQRNSDVLKALLEQPDFVDYEVGDALAMQITENLLSLEAARNDPSVKAHFKSTVLDGVDAEINKILPDFGLGDDAYGDAKDTYSKIRALRTKLKEVFEDGSTSVGKQKVEYQKQMAALQKELSDARDAHEKALAAAKGEFSQKSMEWQINNLLHSREYADKERSKDVSVKLAKIIIGDALAEKGGKFVLDGDALRIKRADDPSMDWYDSDHKSLTCEEFVNKTLAENKLLAVSPAQNNPILPPMGAGGGNPNMPSGLLDCQNQILGAANNLNQ